MNALTLTLIRVAFLAVLWLFVIAAIGVVRTDLLGSVTRRIRNAPAPAPQQAPRPPRPAKPGKGTPRFLVVTEGALSGMSIDLADQQITMGRANDATLVLNDDYASTYHARIFPQDGQWLVEDLGSTNGTYLDRQKVARPTPVPVGVPIRIGKTVLELRR
jgi:pSer/pThr/pTyr-binding forkhead associated (FHA) protein